MSDAQEDGVWTPQEESGSAPQGGGTLPPHSARLGQTGEDSGNPSSTEDQVETSAALTSEGERAHKDIVGDEFPAFRAFKVNDPSLKEFYSLATRFRKKRGPLIVFVGPASHGKTQMITRWFELNHRTRRLSIGRFKTPKEYLIWRAMPSRRNARNPIAVADMPGEVLERFKLESLGPHGNETPFSSDLQGYIDRVLWPTFRGVTDGLVFTINYPFLWSALNPHLPTEKKVTSPTIVLREQDQHEVALQRLLQLAVVARRSNRSRAPRTADELLEALDPNWRLDVPVFVALTKADLYHVEGQPLQAPRRPAPGYLYEGEHEDADLEMRDPAGLLWRQMPEFYDELTRRCRWYTIQYIQAVDGRAEPNPEVFEPMDVGLRSQPRETALGIDRLHQFMFTHPWSSPSLLPVRTGLWLYRRLGTMTWNFRDLVRLDGGP